MQIATLAFNKAARTEFMRDFHTPEARASALETMAKAMRAHDRAAEYYERRKDRTTPNCKLEHTPPGMGGTQQQAARDARQAQTAKAKLKFEQRTERINTIAGAKLGAIKQNQHNQQQKARPALAHSQAREGGPAIQARIRRKETIRPIFNEAAKDKSLTRTFNRSR